MTSGAYPDDVPLESKMVTRGIAGAQRQVESRNYEIRKNVLKYDDVMTEQREKVYSERRQVLDGEDLEPQIEAFRAQAVTSIVEAGTAEGRPDEWDLDALWAELGRLYPVGLTQDEVVEALGGKNALTSERLIEELTEDVAVAYEDAEARIEANALAHVQLGEDPMRTLERRILLAVVDKRWREHLYEMDYLKEGIGLRAMAQRDPLVEYANEGARMFRAMMEGIREETVEQIFANVTRFDAAAQRAARDADEHQPENAGKGGCQNVLEPATSETLADRGEPLARGAGGRDRGHDPSLRDRGSRCIGLPNDSPPIHIHPKEGGSRRASISGWRRLAKRAVMVPPMPSDSEGWKDLDDAPAPHYRRGRPRLTAPNQHGSGSTCHLGRHRPARH